jgi:NAD(P)H-dependent flavin oxidoreductase YrpB (nitropropane dioxygenase family)
MHPEKASSVTVHPAAERVDRVPAVIQGGMGVGVSGWRLAKAVAQAGGLGVVSGVAPDLLLTRALQDGDAGGHVRRAAATYPDGDFAARTVARFFRPGGRGPDQPYRPFTKLDLHQRIDAVRLSALGAYVQIWLAKEGHQGVVGINLLEKVQMWTPSTLLGAMVADVDVVLVGAGVPSRIPRLLDALASGERVELPVDVEGAPAEAEHNIAMDPCEVLQCDAVGLHRPAFLAIVSTHVLAAYLQRDEGTAADGFVVEGFTAGGHNAPPRRREVDATGQALYGDRDVVDVVKMAALGFPFWLAGGYGTPAQVSAALASGARGVQVGTPFALSGDSGLLPELRQQMLDAIRDGSAQVRTDPLASPTGFPFKVFQGAGTVADEQVRASRERQCDLGYLRVPFSRGESSVGYRCPAEPVDAYLRKGGAVEDTVGRMCLCNGLSAAVGLGQTTRDGHVEPPLLTLGADLEAVFELLARYPDGWSAADVVAWLMAGTVAGSTP